MRQSIELYFVVNFVMDAALLAVVARANECLRFSRIAAAAFLAAFYAVSVQTVSYRLDHWCIQFALLIPIGIIVSGENSFRRCLNIVFQLICACMILGGIGSLVPEAEKNSGEWIISALGSGLLLSNLLLNARARKLTTWEVTVYLKLGNKSIHFRALIDTGNRLREPISGQPVLIAESHLLRELLSGCEGRLSFRSVAFGALGGQGTIRCFRPDTVLIRRDKRLIPAPTVWVAVYPGRIPGNTHALAPPSFAVIPGKT